MNRDNLRAPVPLKTDGRTALVSPDSSPPRRTNSGPALLHQMHTPFNFASFTPSVSGHVTRQRKPSYSKIEGSRESHYNLDYPENTDQLKKHQLDPESRFYSRSRPRTLDLPRLLPYDTESPQEQAKYLSHIVSHLYIAIKTLDIQGSLIISSNDLITLQSLSGISDVDLALETDMFHAEMDYANEEDDDDDQDDEDDDDGQETTRKVSPKSAAVVSVRHWTAELKTWIKMKFDMPVVLRICLARVYYAICLSRGQYINLKIYLEIFRLLVHDRITMKEKGLVLDWIPLYKEFANQFPQPDASYDVFEKKNQSQLSTLALEASYFFESSSLPLVFSKIASNFSIPTASLTLSSLYGLLPVQFSQIGNEDDIRTYIPSIFHLWLSLMKSQSIDTHITSLLGKIAEGALLEAAKQKNSIEIGTFGIFEKDQVSCLFNALINNLAISGDKFGSGTTNFFHGYAAFIIFSINGRHSFDEDSILDKITTLLNAIESYVHPSNNGEWSGIIPKLIQALTHQYQKRIALESNGHLKDLPEEFKLNESITRRFVEILLPLVRTGIQSKKRTSSMQYMKTLSVLAYLDASFVLEHCLSDIYESLESVNSTHRLTVALAELSVLARYIAQQPIYRVHVTRLLTLILPGIDSNDLEKTLLTLHCLASFASFIPFHDISDGMSDPTLASQFISEHIQYLNLKLYDPSLEFTIDDETEVLSLISSTTAFKELIRLLCQRIFSIIENLPDPSKSKGIEKLISSNLSKRLTIVFESLSDDIFSLVADEFLNFISENVYFTSADAAGNICGAIIKRDPNQFKRFANYLIPPIYRDISENGAGQLRNGADVLPRDQSLFWHLVILNACIGNAGAKLVEHKDQLSDLSFFLLENVRGTASYMSSFTVHQILTSVSKIKLDKIRLISPEYAKKKPVDVSCWGGWQFDDHRFSEENLKFDWYIPTSSEIDFAVELFSNHVSQNLKNINELINEFKEAKNTKKVIEITDTFRTNLLYLGYALSGMSFLFDPSFEDSIPKLDNLSNQSIQQRLLLISQLRRCSTDLGNELRIENIYENLQKIVEDISKNDFIDADFKDDDQVRMDDDYEVPMVEGGDAPLNSFGTFSIPASTAASIAPSGRGTPLGMDEISTMNPSITFREQKIYCSHYFFGDDKETRMSNETYVRIHKIRALIGKSLHMISNFLSENFKDDITIFKIFLYTLRIWFCDVGNEVVLNHSDNSSMSYSYLYSIQHINRVHKPFTRLGLASRVDLYHRQRVSLHASSRTQTALDRLLIGDVVKLSISNYLDIAKAAQLALAGSMGKIIGSYNVLISKAFKILNTAIENDEHKDIESGLRIFGLKRIKNKLQNDFVNIEQLVDILNKCMRLDNLVINERAQKLYKSLAANLNIPSSTCLIDLTEVDAIRPPDEFIDLEIEAIKIAKSSKKKFYLSRLAKLEQFIIDIEKENSHWKVTSLNLTMLINNQLDLEIPTNSEVIVLLLKNAVSNHPLIARLCLKGLSKILTKIYNLSLYEYDLSNVYNLDFIPREVKSISTKEDGKSFTQQWEKELINSESPKFFLDNKANVGWLFWDETMKVIRPEQFVDMDIREHELEALAAMDALVDKSWFDKVVKMLIADNETNCAFQGTDVFLTGSFVHLMSNGLMKNFKFKELLEIIEANYGHDEKSSHVVICELVSGLLVSSKSISPQLMKERDEFVAEMLATILEHDLSPDTRGIWNIFSWWIPVHVDPRRFPKVIKELLEFKIDKNSDSAFKESARLTFIKSYVTSVTWKCGTGDEWLMELSKNIAHPYQSVREQIGVLIACVSFIYYNESFPDSSSFVHNNIENGPLGDEPYRVSKKVNHLDSFILKTFSDLDSRRAGLEGLSVQEILKSDYLYASLTVLNWLKQALNTSSSIFLQPYINEHIMPFLLNLFNMKDVCKLADISPPYYLKKLSQIPFKNVHLGGVIEMLELYGASETTSTYQLIVLDEFIETFYFKNLLNFTSEERARVYELVNRLIYHSQIEVREASGKALSGIIHVSPPSEVSSIVEQSISSCSSKLEKSKRIFRKKKALSSKSTIDAHGATLVLGSLIHAFTYQSPPPVWIPQVLTILANNSTGLPGVVDKTAKDILSTFKKTRQDTWHVDSKVFTEEQLQDLEGVLWKSYFI